MEKSSSNINTMLLLPLISPIAGGLFDITLLWEVLLITKSIFLAGIASSFLVFPFAFSFITGSFVDSIRNKKGIIIISRFLSIIIIFFIILDFLYAKKFNYIFLIILIFIKGIFNSLGERSYSSLIKYMVSDEYMDKFMSRRLIAYYTGSIFGYIAGGIIIEINFIDNFFIIIFIYIIYIIILGFINTKNINFNVKPISLGFFKSSIMYIKENVIILDLMITNIINDFAADMLEPILLYIIEIEFKLSAVFFSIAIIISLIGGIIGSYFSEKIRKNKYILYVVISFIIPVMSILFISKFIFVIYLSAIAIGILGSILAVIHNSFTYKFIDKKVIGSIQGFNSTMVNTASSFSGIIIGFLIYSYSLYIGVIFTASIFFLNFIILIFMKNIKSIK